jgi:acetyl esterase/lipase
MIHALSFRLLLLLAFLSAARAEPVRILPLGDSITEGGGQICYRPALAKLLKDAGLEVTFVGPKEAPAGLRHGGYGGKNAGQIAQLYADFHASTPADIVLIHAGHNHFAEEQPVPGILRATDSMIATARKANPKVTVLLAQVITSGKLPKYSYLPELNQQLAELAAKLHRPEQPVILVDQATGFNWKTDAVADLVHPNAQGAQKMAECWFRALKPLLPDKEAGFPLPADETAALAQATRKITYKRVGNLDLDLDLFQPAGLNPGESRPAILFIHGGGWSGGQPSAMAMHCVHYTSQGLVTATLRYRLLGNRTAVSPADCLADAKTAMRYLRAHAAELGIDPRRIAAGGGSAGGHLAAALANLEGHDDPHDDLKVSCKPDLLLLDYPVIDLVDAWKDGSAKCRKAGLDPAEFSPALAPLAAMPPTLILAGADDPISSAASNRRFVGRMATAGRDAELFTFAGQPHALFTRQPADPHLQAVLNLGTRFLQTHGWLVKTPLPPLPDVKFERTSSTR